MSAFHDSALVGASGQQGYQISRSLRFNSADSAYLNRTAGTSTSQTIFTYSGWVKLCRAVEATINYGELLNGYVAGNDTSYGAIFLYNGKLRIAGWNTTWRETTQIFRDPSAWYHIVVAVDTTQATAANRVKVYINGIEVISFSLSNNPTQNATVGINNNSAAVRIGVDNPASSSRTFDGYLTEINFIDGQALTPSSFGETDTITGVWKPKKYAGTYGTNGFYLNFSDNSGTTSTTLGKDSSGNSNNWTPNNFSVTAGAGNDSMIDTPTPYADGGNGRGNYCTLNPLNRAANGTMSNGNLEVSDTGTAAADTSTGTLSMKSGKYYFEFTRTLADNGSYYGIIRDDQFISTQAIGTGGNFGYLFDTDGRLYTNGSITVGWTTTMGANDVAMVAYDADSGKLWLGRNGTWGGSGNPASGTNPAATVNSFSTYGYVPYLRVIGSSGTETSAANFGQRPFAYTPPSGFVALNTQNLPEPSIKKPGTYFNTVLWTGNGTSQNITGVGFQTDLLWSKARNQAYSHRLHDAVRGREQSLLSNSTGAEFTQANSITSFDADGFTVGNDGSHNGSGVTYVGWCWDESATPGFDIVTYTGTGSNRTVSHSLGVAPSMMIVKNRDTSGTSWAVYTATTGATNYLRLNSTIASTSGSTFWNNTAPTSSVFSVGTDSDVNANGQNHVAYLWSEVAGFSKFGSYTGNGSSDGPFVFTGMRVKYLMVKRTDSTGDWFILDGVRETYNYVSKQLGANNSGAESGPDVYNIDFTSNGFKLRNSVAGFNASGGTYVFAAFSESPFKYSLAR